MREKELISEQEDSLEPPPHIYKITSPVLYPGKSKIPQQEHLAFQQVSLIQPAQAYHQIDYIPRYVDPSN